MSHRIDTEADIEAGLNALLAADPRLEPVAAMAGPVPLRRRPGGFAGLAGIVVSQQLSTASANAIWGRLAAAYDPFTPQALIRARAPRLAGLGLSAPKIRALKEIAKAIAGGRLDCDALPDLPADVAHAALCAIHGIGPWTADIYLLFCLGHADAWPAGDLALQEAARLAFALPVTAQCQGNHYPRRSLASLARRRGAVAVGLLSRRQAARSGAASIRAIERRRREAAIGWRLNESPDFAREPVRKAAGFAGSCFIGGERHRGACDFSRPCKFS